MKFEAYLNQWLEDTEAQIKERAALLNIALLAIVGVFMSLQGLAITSIMTIPKVY